MAIRVNHCIVFKFESINDICSANIIDVVCCSLDIGGCIAAETLSILCVVSCHIVYILSLLIKFSCYKCFNYMSNKMIPYHTIIKA